MRLIGFPPIATKDLSELGFELHGIPSIVSAIWDAEQPPNGESPTLTSTDAESLVEILDMVRRHA